MSETDNFPVLVRDLMSVGVATCSPDTHLVDIARLLIDKGLEAIVVLDPDEGHALGIVGQDELLKAYTRPEGKTLKAENIMREGVPQVPADIPLIAAAQIMMDLNVRVLYIMHHASGVEYPAGMISYAHMLRHFCASDIDELKDLGIQAERQSPLETFIARREAARKKNIRGSQ